MMEPVTDRSGKTVLYVSGPVTGHENLNREAFEEAGRRLCDAGYIVTIPHDNVAPGAEWGLAMRHAVTAMLHCDGVALLPDWQSSRGSVIETQIALDIGMDALSVDEWCRRGEV